MFEDSPSASWSRRGATCMVNELQQPAARERRQRAARRPDLAAAPRAGRRRVRRPRLTSSACRRWPAAAVGRRRPPSPSTWTPRPTPPPLTRPAPSRSAQVADAPDAAVGRDYRGARVVHATRTSTTRQRAVLRRRHRRRPGPRSATARATDQRQPRSPCGPCDRRRRTGCPTARGRSSHARGRRRARLSDRAACSLGDSRRHGPRDPPPTSSTATREPWREMRWPDLPAERVPRAGTSGPTAGSTSRSRTRASRRRAAGRRGRTARPTTRREGDTTTSGRCP